MNPSTDSESLVNTKIEEIAKTADLFPGVVIIHNIQDQFNKVEYMSPRGAKMLGVSLKELRKLGKEYYTRFFNEDEVKDYLPKMLEMINRNNADEVYSFFQQVRKSPLESWLWYHSSTRILLKDKNQKPLLSITFAVPIDPASHLTNKVTRLLEENNFLRAKIKEFSRLTEREKEIAGLLASGESSSSIGKKLNIATETVKTHRKNIYQKLKIKSAFELLEYARAFDLV